MSAAAKSYELDLGKDGWEKKVAYIQARVELGRWNKMRVWCALNSEDLGGDLFPMQAKLRTYGRGIFSGHLARARVLESGLTELIFEDGLAKLSRSTQVAFLKETTLKQFIKNSADHCGYSVRSADGDFEQNLPSGLPEDKSLLDHLQILSTRFGFFFLSKSFVKELHCLRVGKNLESGKVDLKKDKVAADVAYFTGASAFSQGSSSFHYNSHVGPENKDLSPSDIYEVGNFLKGSSSFDKRLKASQVQGTAQYVAMTERKFQDWEKNTPYELTHGASAQEGIRLQLFSVPCFPGDKLEIKNGLLSQWDGGYLARTMEIEIDSAVPRVRMEATRL